MFGSVTSLARLGLLELAPRMALATWLEAAPAGGTRVFLSPHHDDIAFSLGSFAAGCPGGTLINLFTRSNYLAALPMRYDAPDEEIEKVTAIRKAEDRAFAATTGLERIDLDLDEPPVLGRSPWDGGHLEADVARLQGLKPLLDEIAARSAAPRLLFCPAAIGGHANHRATLDYVLGHQSELERDFILLFYEDLPYARRGKERVAGLRALFRRMEPKMPLRLVWPVGRQRAAAKLDLVRIYASQYRRQPRSLRRFTPRKLLPEGPHEAVWLFT